ncbi:hypothetical protein [Kitasatospora sp. NPDC059673]|uniref:hypothetical protein n=1 Tax=Kitasatospora sp. NPDC059673 TaxID=3346901 RepID=UPI0036A9762C
MRGRIAVTVVAAALLLGGCTSTPEAPDLEPGPTLITAGPEVRPATGDAARRAAEVTAAWPGSAAQQAWTHGYYPTEDTTQWIPQGAFHNSADKEAYEAARIDLRTTLPVNVSGTAEVQFADGSRMTLPQRSAKDTLTWLTSRKDPCLGGCGDGRLSITAVQPGTTTVTTSRGRATIPVWEFTIAGYDQPFRYPAVLTQAQNPPTPGPGPAAGSGGTTLVSVSPDGLVLTATVPHGSCDLVQPGEVHETDQAVVLIGRTTRRRLPEGTACAAWLGFAPVEFRLSHPLGTRAVLGLDDGLPQSPRGKR